MNRDRGSKKWVSLMLPEHVRMLHNLWDEQQKVSKPILDEQQLQLFDEKICEAMAYSCQVKITYYDEGYFKTVTGFIHVYEQLNKVIKLEKSRRFISLDIEDIIDIQ